MENKQVYIELLGNELHPVIDKNKTIIKKARKATCNRLAAYITLGLGDKYQRKLDLRKAMTDADAATSEKITAARAAFTAEVDRIYTEAKEAYTPMQEEYKAIDQELKPKRANVEDELLNTSSPFGIALTAVIDGAFAKTVSDLAMAKFLYRNGKQLILLAENVSEIKSVFDDVKAFKDTLA